MTPTLEQRVIQVVTSQIAWQPKPVDLSATWESLRMDSLDAVEVEMDLEIEFDISIPDHMCGRINSIITAIVVIQELQEYAK